MLKITNFHQHDHWDHNKKYYFFDMGLTSEDHDIISSVVVKNTMNCDDNPSQKICDVAQKAAKKLGHKASDVEVRFYDGSDEGETDWHTDETCRTDNINSLFRAMGGKSEKLADEAYKLLGECYNNPASYTCSISLKGAKTVISSVDIKDLTEDCQKSEALDREECRKQFEDKLVEIPDGYGVCFSSETIHRAPYYNEGRILALAEGEDASSEINKFLNDTEALKLDNVSNHDQADM